MSIKTLLIKAITLMILLVTLLASPVLASASTDYSSLQAGVEPAKEEVEGNLQVRLTADSDKYDFSYSVIDIYQDKSLKKRMATIRTEHDGYTPGVTLPAGTYYAKQVNAPVGFLLNENTYPVTVSDSNLKVLEIPIRKILGTLNLKLVSDFDSGSLEGACYKIYEDKACKTEITTVTTDKDGYAERALKEGTYYIKKIAAPERFHLSDKVMKVELTSGNYEKLNLKVNHELRGEYAWPVPDCKVITSDFGPRTQPVKGATTNHRGIDIGCDMDSYVLAVERGTVILAKEYGNYGNCIKLKTKDGSTVVYGHLNKIMVSEGQKVNKYQVIAKSGNTGVSTGPHLHIEIHNKEDKELDPTLILLKSREEAEFKE